MRMHRHYTPEEIQFVKKNIRGRSYADMARLFNKRFGTRITLKQMGTLICKHVPHNIGKTHKPWEGNYMPVGSERVVRYGDTHTYIEVKTGHHTWKRKHAAIWEKANGKVPKRHIVIFADGDSRNFALGNLLLVSRAELIVMNNCGLHSADAALTRAGKIIADIKMAVTKRKRSLKKRRKHV